MGRDEKPLHGITVVELALFVAAPSAARMLADWGAEVIKIESPKGDPMRYMGRLVSMPIDNEKENPAYDQQNSGKKGIILNLKTEEGQEAMHRLLAKADVFITNNRQDALERMSLSYEQLSVRYPALVYGQVSGYGEKGPDKDKPGYDFTAYYARGGISGTLYEKGTSPLLTVAGFGDTQVGLCLASGICAALLKAQRTGQGEKVSVSIYQTAVFCMGHLIASSQYGKNPYPRSRMDISNPLQNAYETKDGRWIQGAVNDFDNQFSNVCRLIGREDLTENESYRDFEKVKHHSRPLIEELDKTFKQKNIDEWMEIFKAADMPFDKEMLWEEILKDPQAWADDILCHVEGYPERDGMGTARTLIRTPVKFKEAGLSEYKKGPRIGEHTAEILEALGYAEEEIRKMKEKGAVS